MERRRLARSGRSGELRGVKGWSRRFRTFARPRTRQSQHHRERLSVDAAKVTREARFKEDLEADSLDLVEFVMELESEFGVEVPEQELEGITTVGQAFDLIVAKTK
ncbi:MAG: acyl carrier protein [Actinobacteria bacterium]|nr:acyl carrier protein [Actinomycetota bacterium]